MQVSVEAPSKIQRRVTVVVPVEKFDQVYDKQLMKLSKTAKIDGFRPGKVPMDVIKKRFGDTARNEALNEVIETSLYSAIDQEKLSPVSVPRVEPKIITPGQPVEFVATFEILPEITSINFNVPTLEKTVSTIEAEDVERVIQHLREQHTVWKKVDRAAQNKDQVFIDFRGTIDGIAFQGGEAHDYPVILGSKMMIPGFEEGLLGVKTGDDKVISVSFPQEYFAKEYAGKKAEFAIKVIKIMEPELPELNEDFVKKLGIKSAVLDDLRNEVRNNLQRELKRLIQAKLKAQVFDALLEQNVLEIPQALIERESQRIHNELHPHHEGQEHGHSAAEMAMFDEAAKRNVALGLLIGQYVKQNALKPAADKVQIAIDALSAAYENPSEVNKWYATNKKARAEIEMQVLEEEVMQKLLESVKVTEKTMSYEQLVASSQQHPHG